MRLEELNTEMQTVQDKLKEMKQDKEELARAHRVHSKMFYSHDTDARSPRKSETFVPWRTRTDGGLGQTNQAQI